MTDTTQFNTRIPKLTQDQIERLIEATGMTKTQLLIIAIDRLHKDKYVNPRRKLKK